MQIVIDCQLCEPSNDLGCHFKFSLIKLQTSNMEAFRFLHFSFLMLKIKSNLAKLVIFNSLLLIVWFIQLTNPKISIKKGKRPTDKPA
uniref:Transmembrane protein n=1 Tax=Onchocerca volvulus TaxID=6282 RepID=A0A8R1Y089_ONCVO